MNMVQEADLMLYQAVLEAVNGMMLKESDLKRKTLLSLCLVGARLQQGLKT